MTIKNNQTAQANWSRWINRDDRVLLKRLARDRFEAEVCRTSLSPWLDLIVTSVSFNSHRRWGLQPSKDETNLLVEKFLAWLEHSGEWKHISALFAQTPAEDSCSLPLLLSRSYQRFNKQRWQNADTPKHIQPYGPDEGSWLEQLSQCLVQNFSDYVKLINEQQMRLVFQMHLEGLIDEEIAALTGRSVKEISMDIFEAKEILQSGINEGEYGT